MQWLTNKDPTSLRGTKRHRELAKEPQKKLRAQRPKYDATIMLTDGDLEQITDALTLATEDQWAAIEAQQKVAINAMQAELRDLRKKMNMLHPTIIQAQASMTSSSTRLTANESRAYSLPSTVLVGAHLPVDTGLQLDLAKLPREVLQGFHTVVLQEIHHRDQTAKQQLDVAMPIIA